MHKIKSFFFIKQKNTTLPVVVFLLTLILIPAVSLASLGVGIGPGVIKFDQPLKPGGLYTAPPYSVINTGDEPSDYAIAIEYQGGQSELKPPKEWFVFNPSSFHLDPGQSQAVEVKLNIPLKTVPGNYYTFLSGYPVSKGESSESTSIKISAASKVYFSVAPANIFQASYYRVGALWKKYAPWPNVVAAILLVTILVVILRRFLTFKIGFGKRNRKDDNENGDESEDIHKILSKALKKVEKYTSKLSEEKFEEVFIEANRNRRDIIKFFYKNDPEVLQKVSPELKKILILSSDGLKYVKNKNGDKYKKILEIVVAGIIEQ